MAQDLPAALRRHEFTNPRRDNWCWGLANPQALKKPYPATGNARLFHVDVPDKLFPKSDQDKRCCAALASSLGRSG